MTTPAATRRSVPLTVEDVSNIDRLMGADTSRMCIIQLAGVGKDDLSDAQIMHALVVAGIQHIAEMTEEAGYYELARTQTDEDREFHATMRGRRT